MMKRVYVWLVLAIMSGQAVAEIFVETITELSARDALALQGDVIYASNYNSGRVFRIGLDGTVTEIVEPNSSGPAGIRLNAGGDIFIAMYNTGSITRIDPQGNQSTFVSGINEPIALDMDDASNLYVSSFAGTDTVTMVTPDGTISPIAKVNQLTAVSSLCLDGAGDIYVSSYSSGDVYRVTPAGEVSLFASTGAPGISFIQFDDTNNLFYVTITNRNEIMQIDMQGNAELVMGSDEAGVQDGPAQSASIQSSIGLAVSDNGKHIYFASNTHVRRLNIADPAVDQVRPYFTSEATAAAESGADFSFQFEFVDPNDDPLTLTLENVPDWAQFDGVNTLTGVPTDESANESFTVSAQLSDSFATVSQDLLISVAESTAPPATPTPPATPDPAPVTPEPVTSSSSGGSMSWLALLLFSVIIVARRTPRH